MVIEQSVINSNSLDWMRKQNSSTYDLIIADPPYNVGKDYGVVVDKVTKEDYLVFLKAWTLEASRLLKDNGTIYIFIGFRFISYLYEILENDCKLNFNSWICWHYTQGVGRKKGFSPRHDDILMFTKDPKKFTFNLDAVRVPQKYYRSVNNMRGANPGDVWEFSRIHYCQEGRQEHPTQKPEGLIERMVLASSSMGDNVLDPFSGSGTTLRVCQQLSRRCTGVEINPEYIDSTKKRLSKPFTSFDSVDPKMKRVPLDLNKEELSGEYVENHKQWFLKNHEKKIESFEKQVENVYDKIQKLKINKKCSKNNNDIYRLL